ncbi:MAG: CehA/McbA family metallohydrolase [Clostridia bacterium]|nr:CehA/McbA family metallohydrolase [Clostridia bacterium]
MKKYLLPQNGCFYKANLHCHSTFSDGNWTPKEIKENYKEQGYSVVAYTDHNVLLSHDELSDEEFLALNGVEININDEKYPDKYAKTCHICMIAIEPDNLIHPCWHREKYLNKYTSEFRDLVKFDETKPDVERIYNSDCINSIIKMGRDAGFFVTYNHPTWSGESYDTYMNYEGMHAMEVCNYECICIGHDEHNEKIYDAMLKSGKRIYCVATDDNHNRADRESSFGAFTMIKADKLEYKSITEALVKGEFYATEGPLINELWYEDGKVYVTFSPAREAFITNANRRVSRIKGEGDELITKACFNVENDDKFFRITVVGADGKRAYTNAYFIDKVIDNLK